MQPNDIVCHLRDGVCHNALTVPRVPSDDGARDRRHLWVIGLETEPVALEECPFAQDLPGLVIKHTNLTGGADAHCGGELWFLGPDTICINGGSGRYGPRSEAELMEAARAVAECGFEVCVIGWDEDADRPKRVAVGEKDVTWIR